MNKYCSRETQKYTFNSIFKFFSMKTMLRRVVAMVCLMVAMVATVEAQNSFAYQAVIRNAKGELVSNQEISMQFSLVYEGQVVYCEIHKPTTNQYGNIQVNVGEGQKVSGSFAAVPWSTMKVMMKIEVDPQGGTNYIDLGTIQLQPAPYAMYAAEAGAVSTIQPGEPKSDGDALFEVKDKNGNVVFAVYRDGVRVFVDDADSTKAMATGFAVAGRRAAKEGEDADIFSVTAEGTQVFVSEEDTAGGKPMATGFAVAGRRAAKDMNADLFTVNSTGTQIYINNDVEAGKPMATGFAVAGRRAAKDDTTGSNQNDKYLEINADGTRVYIDDDSADNSDKPIRTGFAVAGRRAAKGESGSSREGSKYMEINADGTQIYVDDKSGKPMATGFAVAGRRAAKGENIKLFEVNSYGTQIYIETSSKAMRTGFAVAGRRAAKDGVTNKYLVIDADGTCIYVDYEEAKAMQTGFAVAGRRAAKDGTPNTILSVDNVDGTRAYIDDVDGKAMATGFAVAGRRAAKEGEKFMSINKDTVKITTTQLEVQSTEIDEAVLIMNGGSTKITTDLFVLAEKEGDEPLLSADNSGVDVSTNVVVRGDVTQAVESEALDLAEPILMTAINKIDTLDCASAVTELGEVKGYRLLKIYGNGLFALSQTPDADGNSFILFDADGNIASTIEDAFAAVVMTNPGTTDAKVLVWPLKQHNSLNISFGITSADSSKQYVRVDAIINASAGIESKVEALAAEVNTGSVEVEGRTVYGNIITLTANNNKGYHFVQWSDGSDVNPRTLRYAGTTAFTAMFDINTYNISVGATDGGAVDGSGIYNHGEEVTITATANEHYHFVNWNGDPKLDKAELTFVAKNDTSFTATFALNSHTVKYMVDNEEVKDTTIAFGQPVPQPKTNIEKEGHNLVWEIDEEMTMPDEPITVLGRLEAIEYTIAFANGSDTVRYTAYFDDLLANLYQGEQPAKESTAKYTYTFASWEPAITSDSKVTRDSVFTAKFDSTVNKYTIRFVDEDGSILQTSEVEYDAIPVYKDRTPEKASTNQFDYEFVDWNPSVKEVDGEATYTAVFTEKTRSYSITVIACPEQGGTVSGGGAYPYSAEANVTLIAQPNEGYEFKKWSDDETATATRKVSVTGTATYTAEFAKLYYAFALSTEGLALVGENPKPNNEGKYEYGTVLRFAVADGYTLIGNVTDSKGQTYTATDGVYSVTLNDGDVEISAQCKMTTFYVDGTTGGNGTAASPLASIADAVAAINTANYKTDYTIVVKGKLNGNQSIVGEPIYEYPDDPDDKGDIIGYNPININADNLILTGESVTNNSTTIEPSIDAGWRAVDGTSEWQYSGSGDGSHAPALFISTATPVIITNLTITGGYALRGCGIYISDAESVILGDGVKITNNCVDDDNEDNDPYGGGVYVAAKNSTTALTILAGAEISNNSALCGGGICVEAEGEKAALVTMQGGTIKNNTSSYHSNLYYGGGGVLIMGNTTFTMTGGSIESNYAESYGGGVCVYEGATFNMNNGTIGGLGKGNSSSVGGGVCVTRGIFNMKEVSEIEGFEPKSEISYNESLADYNEESGAGVCARGGTFNMYSGTISHNKAEIGNSGGVEIGTEGAFNMTGGIIVDNYAGLDGKGVYFAKGKTTGKSGTFNISGTAKVDVNNEVFLFATTINVGSFDLDAGTTVAKIQPENYSTEVVLLEGESNEFCRFEVEPYDYYGTPKYYTIAENGMLAEQIVVLPTYYDYDAAAQKSVERHGKALPIVDGKITAENIPTLPTKTVPDGSDITFVSKGWFVKGADNNLITFDAQANLTATTSIYACYTAEATVVGSETDEVQLNDVIKLMDDPLTDYTLKIQGTLYGPQEIFQSDDHKLPRSITLQGTGSNPKIDGGWDSDKEYNGIYDSDDFDTEEEFNDFIKQPVLTIATPAPIVIKNLTITGGYNPDGDGGGIYMCPHTNVTIGEGTEITGNYAGNGGGVYVDENCVFNMTGGTVDGNEAGLNGGGVFVWDYSVFTMTGGTISNNLAVSNPDLLGGGAVYVDEYAEIYMGGDAYIPAGVNGSNGEGKNDVMLINQPISIISNLEKTAPVATITPPDYSSEPHYPMVVDGYDENEELRISNYNKFDVMPFVHTFPGETYPTTEYYEIEQSGRIIGMPSVYFVYYKNANDTALYRQVPVHKGNTIDAGKIPTASEMEAKVEGKEGYVWKGWYEKQNGVFVPFDANAVISDSKTYYGVWSKTVELSESGYPTIADVISGIDKCSACIFEISGTIGAQYLSTEIEDYHSITLKGKTGTNATIDGGWREGSTPTEEKSALTIYTTVPVIIENLTITGGYAEFGGGIEDYNGNVTISDGTIITANYAKYGGGVCVRSSGKLFMSEGNISISNNIASNYGGGIYAQYYGYFYLNGGQITNNKGGGIYVADDYVSAEDHQLAGVSVSANTANSSGIYYGGVYCEMSYISMRGNTAVDTFYLRQYARPITIIGQLDDGVSTTISPETYSEDTQVLDGDDETVAANCGKFKVIPQTKGNDGKPLDVPIQWTIDETGYLTPAGSGGGGTSQTIYVSPGGDDNYDGTTQQQAVFTFEQAFSLMTEAKEYTIELLGDFTEVVQSISHDSGVNATKITIDGKNNKISLSSSYPLLTITTAIPVEIKNLEITGNTGGGGGLHIGDNFCNVTLGKGTKITNNKASFGGGVHNYGQLIIDGAEISSNTAQNGGGICVESGGEIDMQGGTISNNTANNFGGGIYSYGSTVTMTSGTISGNIANGSGGAIFTGFESTFKMGGSASIPAGATVDENFVTGSGKNDVYLHYDSEYPEQKITILNSLNATATVATITPATYATTVQVLDGDAETIAAKCDKFAVTPQGTDDGGNELSVPIEWSIDNQGYLKKVSGGSNNGGGMTEGFTEVTGGTIPKSDNVGWNDNDYEGDNMIIPSLLVCNHLVSQYEYEQLMTYYGAVNSAHSDLQPGETGEEANKNTPAYYVSWIDAIIYCNLRSEAEGLEPVYDIDGVTNPKAEGKWEYWSAAQVGGKYYSSDISDGTGWDSDGGNFHFNFSANGYRLLTSAEFNYLLLYYPDLITNGDYDEWCNNYNGYSEGKRIWFNGTGNEVVDAEDAKINYYRAENFGFRIVRNIPTTNP